MEKQFSGFIAATDEKWEDALSFLDYDFYHTPSYTALEANRLGGISKAFLFKRNDLIFFVPLCFRNDSFLNKNDTEIVDACSAYGYPSPLFSTEALENELFCNEALQTFLFSIKKIGICSLFIRFHPMLEMKLEFWNKLGELVRHGDTIYVDLKLSREQIWSTIRKRYKSYINHINKDRSYTFNCDWSYIDQFIDSYYKTMDRVNASEEYYFKEEYFKYLNQNMGNIFKLYSINCKNSFCCGAITSNVNGLCQYHLGATNPNFLKTSATKYLFYKIIMDLKRRDKKILHLGGGVSVKDDSLLNFKKGFSKLNKTFYSWRKILDKDKYNCLMKKVTDKRGNLVNNNFPEYR